MIRERRIIYFLEVLDDSIRYRINGEEKSRKISSKMSVERLNNLLEVLDDKYALIDGIKAIIRENGLNSIYTSEELALLEAIIEENKEIAEEKLVVYTPHKKRYSKDLVGNIDNDEKVDYLIDVALDKYRLTLRKSLSLYKGNEVRVKKYFKMAGDINYSEINGEGETPKSNIILTEALYRGINSNYIDSIMEKNNIPSDKFYLRLYSLITLYYRIHFLKRLKEIEIIDYRVTIKIHDELVELFNRDVVQNLIKIAITDSEYVYR